MKSNARVLGRFKGYSLEDCECKYCLYYAGKKNPCPLETCCCENERNEAIKQEKYKPSQ